MEQALENGSYIATMLGVGMGFLGGLWALWQYRESRRVQKAGFLNDLIQRFGNADIQQVLNQIEEDETADSSDDWISKVEKDFEFKNRVDASFRFFANVCYLMNHGIIEGAELSFFAEQLKSILVNRKVLQYLVEKDDEGNYAIKDAMKEIVEYAKRNGYDGYADVIKSVDEIETLDTDVCQRSQSEVQMADEKVVLIRVSRLYRDGMGMAELLKITQAKWRASLDVISTYKIAMAVAGGTIKGVFKVDKWRKVEDGSNRVEFLGNVAEDEKLSSFRDKRINSMFPRGSANPIRYATIGEVRTVIEGCSILNQNADMG